VSDDLKAYVDYHQLRTIIVLGHSMGGKTAMQFACSHSNILEKLIVADIAPKYYPPHHQDIIDGLNDLNFNTIASRGEADQQLARHIPEIGIRQFLLKNLYWVEKNQLALRINLPVLSNKMENVGENIGATDFYKGPTLFLKGARSEYVVDTDVTAIKKHFPQAIIETVGNTMRA